MICPPTINDIGAFLRQTLAPPVPADDDCGVYHPSERPVHRLGMALEYAPGLAEWAQAERVDALFLHRPWNVPPNTLAPEIGVVFAHSAFDTHLTLGFNARLAAALGMTSLETLGYKNGVPLGMIGDVTKQHVADFFDCADAVLGGSEDAHTSQADRVTRVAVVNAMTRALVHEASERGADVYITGQFRQPGRVGVLETGIGVVIVGHARAEAWGLRALSHVLRERWVRMQSRLYPDAAETGRGRSKL